MNGDRNKSVFVIKENVWSLGALITFQATLYDYIQINWKKSIIGPSPRSLGCIGFVKEMRKYQKKNIRCFLGHSKFHSFSLQKTIYCSFHVGSQRSPNYWTIDLIAIMCEKETYVLFWSLFSEKVIIEHFILRYSINHNGMLNAQGILTHNNERFEKFPHIGNANQLFLLLLLGR